MTAVSDSNGRSTLLGPGSDFWIIHAGPLSVSCSVSAERLPKSPPLWLINARRAISASRWLLFAVSAVGHFPERPLGLSGRDDVSLELEKVKGFLDS